MKTFLQPLQNLAEMEEIQKQAKKNRGILEISGCMESQKTLFYVWAFRAFSMSSGNCRR